VSEQGLTSPPTQYRLSGRQFYRSKRPNQQYQKYWRNKNKHSAADKLTNCALFDKSTNFGTEVDQYVVNKFGCGAIGQLPPGGRGGHFSKWPPADTQKLDKVRC